MTKVLVKQWQKVAGTGKATISVEELTRKIPKHVCNIAILCRSLEARQVGTGWVRGNKDIVH